MKRLALGLLIFISSHSAYAEGGLFVGLNSTSFSSSVSGVSFDTVVGFEAGYAKIMDFGYEFFLRTGAGITQRNAKYSIGSGEWELDYIMLEIPITLLYDFGDIIAGFAGINANYAASKSCTYSAGDCTLDESAEDFIMTFTAGMNMALTTNHIIEVYFETSMGEAAPNLEYSSLGGRYVYMFN